MDYSSSVLEIFLEPSSRHPSDPFRIVAEALKRISRVDGEIPHELIPGLNKLLPRPIGSATLHRYCFPENVNYVCLVSFMAALI